jgi:hypothetical protein
MRAITGICVFSLVVMSCVTMAQPATESNPLVKRLLKPAGVIRTGNVDNVGQVRHLKDTGDYLFVWKGLDGRTIQATYVPQWKAQVTLLVSVRRESDNTWRYLYTLRNLPRSPLQVTAVYMLTNVQPLRVWVEKGWRFVGVVNTYKGKAHEFAENPLVEPSSPLKPGAELRFQVLSEYPPAVTDCFVTTDAPIIRVPEEMPTALADRLPRGFEGGLHGYTLAPTDSLTPERFLAQWRVAIRVGWVTDTPLARQLTEQVEGAVKSVQRGDRSAARDALAAIQKLVGQHQKHIEPEAQALLLESLPYLLR